MQGIVVYVIIINSNKCMNGITYNNIQETEIKYT